MPRGPHPVDGTVRRQYDQLKKFGLTEGDSAAVKYDYWDSHEKLVPFVEVPYDSLRAHPMFVSEDQRKSFGHLDKHPGLADPGPVDPGLADPGIADAP